VKRILDRCRLTLATLTGACAAALTGCGAPPPPAPAAPVASAPPGAANPAAALPVPAPTPATAIREVRVSGAATARAYRQDAASHVYGLNQDRIFKGRLPPMLYAIGTLEVDLDGQGKVRSLHWMRRPSHAPEVVAEIERTVRAAAPYPAPSRMGKVVWTDTWLWHKSGRFQLDTLTEGQD
jgi:protein TonB